MRPISFALLAACSSAAPDAAPAPPPAPLALTVVPAPPGGLLTLTVAGLGAHEEVWLAVASSADAGAGPCPPLVGGACLDLRSPTLLGRVTADATGRATDVVRVPPRLPVHTWACFQAAAVRGPGGSASALSEAACAFLDAPCAVEVDRLDDVGDHTMRSWQAGRVTLTGAGPLVLSQGVGLGVGGGLADTTVDSGEAVTATLPEGLPGVRITVAAGGAMDVEAWDDAGVGLGVRRFQGPGDHDVSAAFPYRPVAGWRAVGVGTGVTLGAVGTCGW